MKRTKLTALFLAILLTLTAVSCGSGAENPPETTASDDETTTIEETTTGVLTDSVPKLDFEGTEFRTIEQENVKTPFALEESDGDVVNDAIWARARAAEERFNVTIVPTVMQWYTDLSSTITKAVMSGSDEYDLVFGQMYQTGADAQQGIFADWNQVPYVNFVNPWYVKSINEASVGDKLYMLESELSITYFQQTWMMLYNKTKAAEMQDFPNLYKLVDEGKWTLDELNRLSADVYRDVNGNGERDNDDFYGFAGTPGGCLLAAFVYGAKGKIVELDSDLNVKTHINSEHTINVLGKMSKLFHANEGTIVKTDALSKTRKELFPKSRVLFEAMQVNDLINSDFGMRNMSDEFGVLPLPKYDEAQEEYYTAVDGGASVMVIPTTAKNLEMIGALTEAMSAYSYNNVTPVYIGVAIEQKGTRDEESIRMMREILDSRVITFDYLFDGSQGWVMKLPTIIKDDTSITSTIQSNMNSMTAYYEGIIDFMTKK